MKTRSLVRAGLAALAIALVGLLVLGAGRARAAVLATISQPSYDNFGCSPAGLGQSFTATATGFITTVRLAPLATGVLNLNIYAGAGNAGALLHTQAVSWVAGGGSFQTVTLTSSVAVTSGGVYTVYVMVACTPPFGTAVSTVDLYPGGNLYNGPSSLSSFDLMFEVVIEDGLSATSGVDTCAAGQINCGAGDEYVTITRARDSHGDPALHFYCLNAAGNGALAEVLTQDDFDSAPEHPSSNTRVATISGGNCRVPISVWVLTTGEYQINIGPDRKGNTIVVRFTGLPPANITVQRIDADR